MRPLKPYVLALSGFIAAVFSAVFPFAQPETRPVVASNAPQPDLQAKRTAPASELAASRENRPAEKTPLRDPCFPTDGVSRNETLRLTHALSDRLRPAPRARLIDRRQQLLVGVVELRI